MRKLLKQLFGITMSTIVLGSHIFISCRAENSIEYVPFGFETGGTNSTSLSEAKTKLGIPELPLSILNGGTGATNVVNALANLGISIESGTWTPEIRSINGINPSHTVQYRYARWLRINDLCYVTFFGKWDITNSGTDYACVTGLPFPAADNVCGQALALHQVYGAINQNPTRTGVIPDSSSRIDLLGENGAFSAQWQTGTVWVGFSGVYLCQPR